MSENKISRKHWHRKKILYKQACLFRQNISVNVSTCDPKQQLVPGKFIIFIFVVQPSTGTEIIHRSILYSAAQWLNYKKQDFYNRTLSSEASCYCIPVLSHQHDKPSVLHRTQIAQRKVIRKDEVTAKFFKKLKF